MKCDKVVTKYKTKFVAKNQFSTSDIKVATVQNGLKVTLTLNYWPAEQKGSSTRWYDLVYQVWSLLGKAFSSYTLQNWWENNIDKPTYRQV